MRIETTMVPDRETAADSLFMLHFQDPIHAENNIHSLVNKILSITENVAIYISKHSINTHSTCQVCNRKLVAKPTTKRSLPS